MTWALVFTVGAYLVCGIPFGLIVAMAMGHVDVRTVGSGNIGTTNVARSVGKGAAGLTLLLDAAKGLVWMLVARWAIAALALSGDMASLDHTWATSSAPTCASTAARASPWALARRSGSTGPSA